MVYRFSSSGCSSCSSGPKHKESKEKWAPEMFLAHHGCPGRASWEPEAGGLRAPSPSPQMAQEMTPKWLRNGSHFGPEMVPKWAPKWARFGLRFGPISGPFWDPFGDPAGRGIGPETLLCKAKTAIGGPGPVPKWVPKWA